MKRNPLTILAAVLCVAASMAQAAGPTAAQLQKENDTLATELAESNARAGKVTQTLLGLRQKTKALQSKLDRVSVLLEIRTQQRDTLKQGKGAATPTSSPAKPVSSGGLSADEALRLLEQIKANQKELRELRMSVTTQKTAIKLARVQLAAAESRSETHAANAKKDREAVDQVRRELDAAQSEASLNQNLASKANADLVATLELLTTARKEVRRLKGQLADRKDPQPKVPEIPPLATASPAPKEVAPADPDKRILVTPSAGAKTATRKPVVAQAKPITGTIRSIAGAVVTVSIGRTAGLKPNTKLIVFRDGTFVGYLLIGRVADTTSTGSMSRTIRKPSAGDTVTDRIDID
jgi:hypothetical protein